MSTVTSQDGTTIGYTRAGTGPALIMIDAASGFRGFSPMTGLAKRLEPSFTVITYDRRGRGESGDAAPYAVDREVEDLAALIDAAGGSACVYGFSSGALLGLYAASQGLPITKVAMLEPPLEIDGPPNVTNLAAEINDLVAAGRRGDAVVHFHNSIGVPEDITSGMQQSPAWPALESIAHTLAYDSTITSTFPVARLPEITTPALVLASTASDERLRGWAEGLADALPDATFRTLPGEWHGISEELLAPVLSDFFAS